LCPTIDAAVGLSYLTVMTIRPIITLPDTVLRQVSKPIETVDADVVQLADDMLETMYDAPGVGLAAIQIGIAKRIVVLDVADEDEQQAPLTLINPEIVTHGDAMRSHEEGCLSIPEVLVEIDRPTPVTVRYVDREGKPQEIVADGLLGTAIQHEIDHLDGKLIIDYMTRLKRDIVMRKFKKLARG